MIGYLTAVYNHNFLGIECVRLLLELAPWTLNTPDQRGLTPVHVAVIANNLPTLLLLLNEYKCSADVYDNNFRTPLHWAARLGSCDIVEALLKHGAKVQRDTLLVLHHYIMRLRTIMLIQ